MATKRASRKRKETDITKEVTDSYKKNFECSNIKLKKQYPLTENQLRFYHLAQMPQTNMVFVDGPAGSMKAQPLSEPIATPTGWKKMGELQKNDLVFSSSGSPTKVCEIFPQGIKKIYKVTFSDGTYTRCCGDHLWSTSTYLDRNRWESKRINGKRKKTKKLDAIFKVRSTLEIKESLKHLGRINHMIPIISSPVEFSSNLSLLIHPYVFGLLLGDGCFRTTPIRITTEDDEIVMYLEKMFGDDFKKLNTQPPNDYRILQLKDSIEKLGMYKLYSSEKFIPTEYKISSISNRIELLQGLFDSDGCATKNGACVYTTTSKKLADDIIEIVNSLGGIAHKTSRLGILRGVEHKLSYILHINLPNNIQPFKLTRKLNRYTPNTKYSPKRYIESVEEDGVEECQCILVESPDHLYLTRNYIVTHNTYLAVYSALELLKDRHSDQIIYIRSVVESSSRSMGFLPGEQESKFEPYSIPLKEKLNEIIEPATTSSLISGKYIEAIPVNFVRGLTFHNSIVIIDEAQNMTRSELTTILTRFGRNSKYFVCGDMKQSDIRDSGFEGVFKAFDTEHSLKNNIHCVQFDAYDIARSPILKHITQVLNV